MIMIGPKEGKGKKSPPAPKSSTKNDGARKPGLKYSGGSFMYIRSTFWTYGWAMEDFKGLVVAILSYMYFQVHILT